LPSSGSSNDFPTYPFGDLRHERPVARGLNSKGLPLKTSTGVYPIASTDDAYSYDRNPNAIKAQTISITLPAPPRLNASPQCVGGTVGVSLEGPLVFNAVDAGGRDAVAHEWTVSLRVWP